MIFDIFAAAIRGGNGLGIYNSLKIRMFYMNYY